MTARILVVDDIEANVRLLQAKLSAEYYDVLTASDGVTALAMAAADQPDVILLDVMMPGLDGFETCRRLKSDATTRHIPVVVCTVIREEQLALALGAACYLAKPVRPAVFIGALDQLCPQAAEEASRVSTNSERVGSSKTLPP